MDPQVREQKPGPCPIGKMPMVQVEIDADKKENEMKLSEEQIRLANIQMDTVRLRPPGEEITLAATLRENQNGINTVTARLKAGSDAFSSVVLAKRWSCQEPTYGRTQDVMGTI